jgi:hypothetical protein
MDYNPTTQKYSITVKKDAGEFKFRLNRDWGTNYGDNDNLSLESVELLHCCKDCRRYYITAFNAELYYQ